MEKSILLDTKKVAGLDPENKAFDADVIMHINAAFLVLHQLGYGPQDGFMIEDETTEWTEFIPKSVALNAIKQYIYMRLRLIFDPPEAPHHITALKEQITETEHRLKYQREVTEWSSPSSQSLP